MSWPELIREKAAQWGQQIRSSSQSPRRDESAIALAEEAKLVQRVFPVGNQDARRVVLFSGIDEEDGSGSTCARAAEALAERGEGSVCVVDTALRSPVLHRCFGLDNARGWAEAVTDALPIQEFTRQLEGRNLWILPAGAAAEQSRGVCTAERMGRKIAELRAGFQYVLIHSSPLSLDPAALSLSQLADGIVLVMEANTTRRERARRMKQRLEAAGARIVGVVLNNRTYPIPESLYRRL